ncbi:phage holin family protein [candidate division KSB1 bacterium]|nr:phage holin family protein [bacterium]RKY75778.1 MAG: phage holin family protein [candidate division KSB1 bacterium]RKY84463.1 MAG: phage holin family protein [candidate division KSB1 bacterium]RKY90087.1 MAG: phage holin family protein [candidate division KSB1 bacterium]
MRGFVIRWIVNAIALIVTATIIKGMDFNGILAPFVAALVIGILNAVVRPFLILITLPINVLSLGLFTFVINGLMIAITAKVVNGFNVENFWAAFVGAIFMSVISFILSFFISDKGNIETIIVKQ